MTLGTAPRQGDLLRTTVNCCSGRVAEDSIYGVLHRECFRLFADEMFADLFTDVGPAQCPADDRGGGDGAAADRGALGSGGGGSVLLRRPV